MGDRIFDEFSIRKLRYKQRMHGKEIGIRDNHLNQARPTVRTLERLMDRFGVDETAFFKNKDGSQKKEVKKRVFDRDAIKRLRDERGMTLEDLGRKLGVTRQAIGYLERGGTMPGMTTLEKLMKAFGVDEKAFFKDKE